MALTSKTGLLEGIKKPVKRQVDILPVEFPNVARPAPYVLRPFAGVYNPFPYGCSILCNHPADYEAKDVVKRAKDSWANEGKALLLPDELAAIRAGVLQGSHRHAYEDGEDTVPEELFRRYTDTDSRPLTPAPTLASVMTRGSGRRCVTPDPIPTHCLNPTRERTLLVLDLRRSHSQDTLSWHGTNTTPTTVLQPPSKSISPSSSSHLTPRKKKCSPRKKSQTPGVSPKVEGEGSSEKGNNPKLLLPPNLHGDKSQDDPSITLTDTTTAGSGDEDVPKRRGKRRKKGKKSGRDGSRELEKEFQGLPEPGETQISAMSDESRYASTRPSLTPGMVPHGETLPDVEATIPSIDDHRLSTSGNSYIDPLILKQLQRELDQEVLECEFDPRKHKALEEALKSRQAERRHPMGEEMKKLKRELSLPPTNTDLWLSLPRVFSRESVRFELPLDLRKLNTMTPLEYLHNYVSVSSGRKLLYNRVFNRHREEPEDDDDEEEEANRRIPSKNVDVALGEVMGSRLSETQVQYLRDLVGWEGLRYVEFRLWCGLCAVCERLLGPQYKAQINPKSIDPCQEIERADFETLPRKLKGLSPDPRLVTILYGIRDL
ncbi:uncharacterized protein [Anabrus simplex]|uniref:uncharacterized protein n=1 Tax=Anabrus simplex TaxID=316456 RepID=UPI0035A37102